MLDGVHIAGQKFRDGLQAHLSAAGYALIQSIKRSVLAWQEDLAFPWAFEVARYPLPEMGPDQTVDLILRHRSQPALAVIHVCPCDSAKNIWCLGRDPHLRSGRSGQPFLIDQIRYQVPNVPSLTREMLRDAFQVATVEGPAVRPDAWPLAMDLGEGRLASALRHTSLCTNRLMDFLGANRKLLRTLTHLSLLPVLVTGATLAVCRADLGAFGLENAPVELGDGDLETRPWVYHQYIQPAEVKHQVRRAVYPDNLPDLLDIDHLRTVPIVQAAHLRGLLEEVSVYLPE